MGKLNFKEVDTNRLIFNPTLKGEKGNKGDVFYTNDDDSHKKLLFTTPKLRTKVTENHVTFVVDEEHKDFLNFIVDIDDSVENGAVINKDTWFSPEMSEDDVRDKYKGSIKTSRDSGHVFQTKMSGNIRVYDMDREPLDLSDIEPTDLCIGMLELDCVGIGKNTFKNEYTIHHLKVMKRKVIEPVEIAGEGFVDCGDFNIEEE
tara:strand:- start:3901 stop:4509 length:609 start_codon:yes stop_codon:yes gene_type:complete